MSKALARRTAPQTIVMPSFDDAASRTLAETYADQHEKVRDMVLASVVDSPDTADTAAEWAQKIRERRELVASELEFATTLRRIANQFSQRWNPAIKPLDEALDHLRSQISQYTERSRAAVVLALPQAQSQDEIVAATATIVPQPAGVIERAEWRAEIVDVTQIPAEYWQLDLARLNREAREQKEAFAVPGVRAVRGVGVAFRG